MEQNPHIMDDTFAANIAYGVSSATESEILAAAKSAGIDEVIKKRPQQYDNMVGGNGG
jgi:ATP-binding cassette subfamily B protein